MYKKWVHTKDEPTNYTYDKDVIEYINEEIKLLMGEIERLNKQLEALLELNKEKEKKNKGKIEWLR